MITFISRLQHNQKNKISRSLLEGRFCSFGIPLPKDLFDDSPDPHALTRIVGEMAIFQQLLPVVWLLHEASIVLDRASVGGPGRGRCHSLRRSIGSRCTLKCRTVRNLPWHGRLKESIRA
jgi:hypothetical protein